MCVSLNNIYMCVCVRDQMNKKISGIFAFRCMDLCISNDKKTTTQLSCTRIVLASRRARAPLHAGVDACMHACR